MKCEDCNEEPFWAVMDTMKADISYLCDNHYNKRCENKDYDNTHYPIAMWVFEQFGLKKVFDAPVDLKDMMPFVADVEMDRYDAEEAGDAEAVARIDSVLNRYYDEMNSA